VSLDQVAIISDVHGNLTALEAVLDDVASRGVSTVVNLGDTAGKGPRGSAAVDRVREACAVNVRGNWDDFLPRTPADASEAMRWWHDELRADQRAWLQGLPLSHDLLLSGRRVRLFHASASSVHVRVHRNPTDDEHAGMFAPTDLTGDGPAPDLVGYGDIHAVYVDERDGRTLFNVGSVGNPLDEPVPSYVVLSGVLGSTEAEPFHLEVVRVPYDVDAEVRVAHALHMPEAGPWEVELRTGLYRGLQRARPRAI
jgi:predicted phosphodiesterase